jgi:hypothetical protein
MRPCFWASGGKAACVMMPGASINVRMFPSETARVMPVFYSFKNGKLENQPVTKAIEGCANTSR